MFQCSFPIQCPSILLPILSLASLKLRPRGFLFIYKTAIFAPEGLGKMSPAHYDYTSTWPYFIDLRLFPFSFPSFWPGDSVEENFLVLSVWRKTLLLNPFKIVSLLLNQFLQQETPQKENKKLIIFINFVSWLLLWQMTLK